MYVLGIYEATTDTCLHINKVKLNDTSNGSPVLFIKIVACAPLRGQFQIYARCQSHLVITVTIVTCAISTVGLFPLFECGGAIGIIMSVNGYSLLIGTLVAVVCYTYASVEIHIAGQSTEIVHQAIDTEVVAMVVCGTLYTTYCIFLLVERNLTHTVDGVSLIVNDFRHTVLGTLHHHATAEHTTEISTLDGVHRTTGIYGTYTVLLPINWIWNNTIITSHEHGFLSCKQCKDLVRSQCRCFAVVIILWEISCSFVIGTLL